MGNLNKKISSKQGQMPDQSKEKKWFNWGLIIEKKRTTKREGELPSGRRGGLTFGTKRVKGREY